MKITIDQLKNYIGTGLKVYIDEFGEGEEGLIGIVGDEIQTNVDAAEIDLVRPICYRLSDLDKFIPELGFVPIEIIVEQGWSTHQQVLLMQKATSHASFELMKLLFQWHFWPFGDEYFEQGLVIDKLRQHGNDTRMGRTVH